jgi:hypothetical protein
MVSVAATETVPPVVELVTAVNCVVDEVAVTASEVATPFLYSVNVNESAPGEAGDIGTTLAEILSKVQAAGMTT